MTPEDKIEIVAAFVDETAEPLAALSARLEALTAKVDELNSSMGKIGSSGSGGLSQTSSALDSFTSKLNSFGSAAKGIGTTLTTGVTLPIVAIGVAAGKLATDFQQQMEILHTEAGVPQAALAGLGNDILSLAGAVGFSPVSLAEAMYHIESNGKGVISAAQAMDQLKVSAEAASMTGASLDDTTYTLSSTLASGIGGAKGYADMMGVLNGIVGAGDMKFQDLNAAIGTGFFATAAQFGISVQSMGAALDTLTDNGESADEAATRMRMSITLMDAPSAQAAKVLNALGLSGTAVTAATAAATAELASAHVTTTQLADDMRKPDGINVALQDLQTHLEKSGLSADAADAAIAKAFGGGRSDAAILTLLGNIKRTGEAFGDINKNETSFNSDWQTQQETAKQKFNDAWSSIEASLTKLGNTELPGASKAFQDFSNAVSGLVDWYIKLSPAQQDNITKIAMYAAVIGPALVVLGTLASSVSKIITLVSLMGPAMNVAQGIFKGAAMAMGVDIDGVRSSFLILETTMAIPLPLIISVAAAAAALAYIYSQVQQLNQALAGLSKSEAQYQQVSSGLAAAAAKLPAGAEKTKMLALADQSAPSGGNPNGVASFFDTAFSAYFHASGGVFNTPHVGVVAESGPEAIIPLSNPGQAGNIMQQAGLGGGINGGTPSIGSVIANIYNDADLESFMREIAWRLANAN